MRRLTCALILVFICAIALMNKQFFLAIGSMIKSFISPIDYNYIIEREWINSRGTIIRFDDASANLHGDTIFISSKPNYKILRLNKYLNEFSATSLENNSKEIFMDTNEFTK
jgi:hypothetical protein